MTGMGLARRRLRRGAGKGAAALGMCLVLSGCLGEGSEGFSFLAAKPDGASELAATGAKSVKVSPPGRRAELAGGKVIVEAPNGYCIDNGSMKNGFAGGFTLIAACGNLPGGQATGVEPVVMTVQVQPGLFRRDLPSADAMASVMAPARALHKVDGDGLTLVHLNQGGDRGLPKGDPKHWRGALVINGYLVGMALYAPKGSAMAGEHGKELILQLAENLLDASPIRDFSGQATAVPEPPTEDAKTDTKNKRGLRALFSKL